MKLTAAKKSYSESVIVAVDVVPNPNTSQKGDWLLLMKEKNGKSHFLVNDNEEVKRFHSIDTTLETLKEIGFRRAKLFF